MTWLMPSVTATLIGTVVLAATYSYLYSQEKKNYLKTWTLAWCAYAVRYIFMLIMLTGQKNAYLLICNQSAALLSGILLLYGTCQFTNQKRPFYMAVIFCIGQIWIFTANLLDMTFMVTSLPTFVLQSAIFIWTGLIFIKSSSSQRNERLFVGLLFIIWGIHKLDYPFLRPVEWFAPIGYTLSAVLELSVAVGILMIYLKMTKDELIYSENQLKGVYDTSNNIAFVATQIQDNQVNIIDLNRGAEQIFGCLRDALIGQDAAVFHPEPLAKKYFSDIAALKNSRTSHTEYTTMIKHDGTEFPALYTLHPRRDDSGRVIGTLEVTIDISRRKQIEDEINLQSQIIRRMSEGVYVVRKDGVIVFANPKFEEMFGYEPGEMIGQYATITQKNPKETMVPIIRHLREHDGWQGEVKNIRKDGSTFWCYASVAKFYHSEHGHVRVSVHLDISDQKKAQAEKEELESLLRHSHKMEAVGTLSGGIAHEFNNILGIILGNVELAMEDAPATDDLYEFMKEIKKATMRGKGIVQQLLSFSRKDTHQQQLLDLQKTVSGSVKFLRASIPSSITFQQSIAPECSQIIGNQAQIHQVLINLCSNAAQAMEENPGTLSIFLGNKILKEPRVILDDTLPPGNYVSLVVSDTGHGIPEDIIDHVFDPFYTTKDVDKGSGMGLAVVHGIMRAHNGAILIHSKVGQGTTCECYFPAVEKHDEKQVSPTETMKKGSETILFVDDEPALTQIAQRMMERLGYKVFTYTDPLTALDFYQSTSHNIDLVITDMSMPQMTGDQVIEQLLKINPAVKTIVCTGYNSKVDRYKALEIGAMDYISKPFEALALSKAIRKVLDDAPEA